MKFEPKISGTSVTDFEIEIPEWLDDAIFDLKTFYDNVKNQKTMDYILDTFRFSKGEHFHWYCVIDHDTILKIAIMENYPNYEKELIDYFGDKWYNHYIRFNH